MAKNQNNRRRMFADRAIQGGLCLRLVAYWIVCQATMAGTLFAMTVLQGGGDTPMSAVLVPALIVSSLVLPIALVDLIYFSNRFAGPLFSFRRSFKKLAHNEPCDDLRFRRSDLLIDLCDDFNRLKQRVDGKQQKYEHHQEDELLVQN